MELSELVPLANTVILVFIFFYQKFKNAVLLDRIGQQERLLSETRGLVEKQATAIDGQAKVVDTALKYTESFSADKLETIIKREVESEFKQKISDIEQNHQQEKEELLLKSSAFSELAEESITYSNEMLERHYKPLMNSVIWYLLSLEIDARNHFIETMKDSEAKKIIIAVIEEVDEKYAGQKVTLTKA
ncbi:hypothetical protein GCE9029_00956 [Grimontia celer]|uniref:Uncharacterized protein n=1 Tax=Grimontia celer TaxID=1796497 RepID=A0A128EVR0_9GAMM|nr:hypothetical protein [Grimontia celer]CZF78623.1 hypothetical protein GCE9029_00956 [Grimontia celer]